MNAEEYEEALARKDKIIEELREENKLLMRMSLRGADERATLKEKLEKLERGKLRELSRTDEDERRENNERGESEEPGKECPED